jgi:hypothetical protein
MKVYNANYIQTKDDFKVLKHLGVSPSSSADRIEGMFAHQQKTMICTDGLIHHFDAFGKVTETVPLDNHLNDFCDFAEKFTITEYAITCKQPLRLEDLWEDDPIGSGGPGIVSSQSVSSGEYQSIQDLFKPFTNVIYPPDIFTHYSKNDIKKIARRYERNTLFQAELKKRKQRSKAIGEEWRLAQYQELVWLDLTFRFRSWAIETGYDVFVYSNEREGDGSDNYVTLMPGQLECTGKTFTFLREKYLNEMPEIIRANAKVRRSVPPQVVMHALWGQKDPMPYWRSEEI